MSYSSAHETSHLRTYAFRRRSAKSLRQGCVPPMPSSFRRCQILLASSRGEHSPRHSPRTSDAANKPCATPSTTSTSEDSAPSKPAPRALGRSTPPSTRARPVPLREILHQNPRNFGEGSTLLDAGDGRRSELRRRHNRKKGQRGRPSGRLCRGWGSVGSGRRRWMESPDPEYARKKGLEIG